MENKKDIGKVFREKLKDFDKSPDNKVWDAIYADLQQKKKRRFLPFWFTTIGIVLVSGSLLLLIWNYSDYSIGISPTQQEINKRVTITNGNNTSVKQSNNASEINNNTKSSNTIIGSTNDTNQNLKSSDNPIVVKNAKTTTILRTAIKKTSKPTFTNESTVNRSSATATKSASKAKIINDKKRDAAAKIKNKVQKKQVKSDGLNKEITGIQTDKTTSQLSEIDSKQNTIASTPQSNPSEKTISTTETAISENDKKTDTLLVAEQKPALKEPSKESALSKLKEEAQHLNVFIYVAPTYSGYLSAKSPLDKNLDNNPQSSKIAWSYGGFAIYEITDKWSMRFGIGIENLTFLTKDATVNTIDYTNIDYTKGITNADVYVQSGNATKMDIKQKISYTEIPLELKYVLRNGKIGVNGYAGLSYRFLGKNAVSVTTSNGASFDIGKTANLSRNAFAVHFGVGLDYKLSSRIRLNFEPLFKYHLLDYKNARATPYSFGVLTGLEFSLK